MVRMIVTADHEEWKAGQVVEMSWRDALAASDEGWARPHVIRETAMVGTRETR